MRKTKKTNLILQYRIYQLFNASIKRMLLHLGQFAWHEYLKEKRQQQPQQLHKFLCILNSVLCILNNSILLRYPVAKIV